MKNDVEREEKWHVTTSTQSTTNQVAAKTNGSGWSYALLGFIFFIVGLGISIATLITKTETIAAPQVFISGESGSSTTEFIYGSQPRLSQPDFFAEVLKQFKDEQQSFIEADLSSMKIRYYESGSTTFEGDILSKGKAGSWWETPAGLYQIQSKSPNHLSSFGGVYQPWSMVFQGNFFIHGWPYYPDGTAVSSQYSGGCIRLSDIDAEQLYQLVGVGTPVLVYEEGYYLDDFVYDVEPPRIDAHAYLVADVQNGTILAAENYDSALPIASITKLMTALIATEYINLDKEVFITSEMLATTSVPRLQADSRVAAFALLFPLLLESSNEAAEAFSQTSGSKWFLSNMNKKADALGMHDTTFTDASGADSGNISTPKDLLHLLTYLLNNRSFLLKISSGAPVQGAYQKHSFENLSNFNETPALAGFLGGKVGKTTQAKETAAVLYEMDIRGEKRTLAFIVLGTEDRFTAISELYAYIQKQYANTN